MEDMEWDRVVEGDRIIDVITRYRPICEGSGFYCCSWKTNVRNALLFIPNAIVCCCSFAVIILDTILYKVKALYILKNGCVTGKRRLESYTDGIVDLSARGDRWEGGIVNGKPCGWGCMFSEEGYLIYEGFLYGTHRIGYGKQYYDVEKPLLQYEGGWVNNMFMGVGKLFDMTGSLLFDGSWIEGKSTIPRSLVVLRSSNCFRTLTSLLEELVFETGSIKDNLTIASFLTILTSLQRLVVKDSCFQTTYRFALSFLPVLQSVEIGMNCGSAIPVGKRHQSLFQVDHCPLLQSLTIGPKSFSDYQSFSLVALPALKRLLVGINETGKSCFDSTSVFQISDLPQLSEVIIGNGCFRLVQRVCFDSRGVGDVIGRFAETEAHHPRNQCLLWRQQ